MEDIHLKWQQRAKEIEEEIYQRFGTTDLTPSQRETVQRWISRNILGELETAILAEEKPSLELQKIYLDEFVTYNKIAAPSLHSALVDKLDDEILLYGLSKFPPLVQLLPKNRLTYEMCLVAVKNITGLPGNIFRSIPKKFLDETICREFVIKNAKMIRKIPLKFITPEFVQDLKDAGVNLDSEMGYIQLHLQAQGKETVDQGEVLPTDNKVYEELQIPIEDLSDYFTGYHRTILESKNITTLSQLLDLYDRGLLAKYLNLEGKKIYVEIMNTAKLLKCKYCDVDPMIDENSEEDLYTVLVQMGAPSIVRSAFHHYTSYTTSQFFQEIRSGSATKTFKDIQSMGENSISQAIKRAEIVTDYHDKHKEMNQGVEGTLEKLKEKLNTLFADRRRIESEIKDTAELIAKTIEKSGEITI